MGWTSLTWVSSLSETLGTGRFPRGLFTAPASVCVVGNAGQVAASSIVPVEYNRLCQALAGDLVLC